MDNKKSITAISNTGKKAYSVYKTKKDYEELKKLWLNMGYSEISEYEK